MEVNTALKPKDTSTQTQRYIQALAAQATSSKYPLPKVKTAQRRLKACISKKYHQHKKLHTCKH